MSVIARKRWNLLSDAILKKKSDDKNYSDISICRFTSFNLFEIQPIETDVKDRWVNYSSSEFKKFSAKIKCSNKRFDNESLSGFNNTGNVCIWVSEEVMAYFCLKNSIFFKNKSVCELGGGMTSMAALFIALSSEADRVMLTDGNINSMNNINDIIDINKRNFLSRHVESRLIRWDHRDTFCDIENAFDYILAADCLFFEELHHSLLQTIDTLLKPEAEAYLFAPSRDGSMERFSVIAENHFNFRARIIANYDDLIWEMHLQNCSGNKRVYVEDIHYPKFIKLTRIKL